VTDQREAPGVPPQELPHVFDRFWRGSAGRAVGGAGIGLAVVRELIVAHGGTIVVESQAGRGTRLTITLPSPAAPRPDRRAVKGRPSSRFVALVVRCPGATVDLGPIGSAAEAEGPGTRALAGGTVEAYRGGAHEYIRSMTWRRRIWSVAVSRPWPRRRS